MKQTAHTEIGAGLAGVSLAEINSSAALQARKDRKYIVPRTILDELLGEHRDDLRVLVIGGTRTFQYESVYFDTPDLLAYLSAAHGRPNRFKVRTRTYLDSGQCMLEVKKRERTGMTVKSRLPYQAADRSRLTPEALAFLGRFEAVAPFSHALSRTLTTRYRRTTLLEVSTASRITIDTDLECVTAAGEWLTLPDLVLVETKTAGGPCATDRLLWAAHYRPRKVSKYCTGMAAIYPDLPANKWNRVLKEHFCAMDGRASHPATHVRVPAPLSQPIDSPDRLTLVHA